MQTVFEGRLARFRILSDGSAAIILSPVTCKSHKSTTRSLVQAEREAIESALSECDTLANAASMLGINLSTLWRKRKAYGLV